MLVGFSCIHCYGQKQCQTLSDQTASDRYATQTETDWHCFVRSDDFSGVIHSAS
jgi:hypothetical protein